MTQHWNENIKRLLTLPTGSAGSAQLNSALKNFLDAWNAQPQSEAALDTAVIGIANALNEDVDDMRQAFSNFRAKATAESSNDYKESFIGSREQLLFGELLGPVLDLHPIFAALLSPTGGMVGPGGFSFHVKEGVLGYHGIAHDAGGYLCRKHDIEPGYEYIIDHTGQPCEDNPLAGQISGIAFWFKVLNLGWLNFLADSDPRDHLTPRAPAPGAPAAAAPPPTPGASDGVTLNLAELAFLTSLITRETPPEQIELIDQGMKSLQMRGLITGTEQDGYTVNDQLILATAVYLEPQLMLEASPRGAAEDQALRFYKWGDYVVEQTNPAPGQIRLAGLRGATHAAERMQRVMPLPPTDLDDISLSLTEDEFDTAVDTAASGELDPGIPRAMGTAGARSAPPNAAADMAEALGSGERVGSIRVHQYTDREEAQTRDLQLIQGSQATWLVSRDSQRSGQVDVTLASPAALDQELGLTPEND